MPMPPIPRLATLALVLLTACANYDFAKARRPDGSMDFAKLIHDLDASGEKSLYDVTWIPLLWLDFNTFERSKYNYPDGYTLLRADAYGPAFCAGSATFEIVDLQGTAIESETWDWLGWGLLYYDLDQRIETMSGPRLFDRGRFALLFRWDHPLYLTKRAPEAEPAEPTPKAGTVQ
jgi:hypothetical protein